MRREDEYRRLADSTRRRGYDEQNALESPMGNFVGHVCATRRPIEKDR